MSHAGAGQVERDAGLTLGPSTPAAPGLVEPAAPGLVEPAAPGLVQPAAVGPAPAGPAPVGRRQTPAGRRHVLVRRGQGVIRRGWPLVRSLVGAAVLVALAARLGAAPFLQGLRAVGFGSVLAALGIGVLTTVFSAWRWCLVAWSLGLRLPAHRAVAECYRALFLNSVLPAGVLGDLNRAVSHGRRSGDLGRGVQAVVIERMAGQVVLVTFAAAVLIAHPQVLVAVYHLVPAPGTTAIAAASIAVLAVAALVAALVLRRGADRTTGRSVNQPAGRSAGEALGQTSTRTATRAASRTATPRPTAAHRVRTWTAVLVLSSAALLGYLTTFVIAARAAGSQAPVADLVPVLVLALLAMGLPVSIGGWGPREAVTTAAFAAIGFGAAQGLTVAVVYGALSFVACLPGAAVVLLRLRRPDTVTTC